jgi:hypothetical protein
MRPCSACTLRFAVIVAAICIATSATAQERVRIGGQAFGDYFYVASSSHAPDEGMNGFSLRRATLTTDYTISTMYSARVRFEANDVSISSSGFSPFVKDLYLLRKSSGGHALTAGLSPPPAFTVSEDVWAFRSLEKTIQDVQMITSSRDFGIKMDGPVIAGGALRYAVMVANNSGTRPEADRYKRAYVQAEVRPTRRVVLTLGGDYAGYGGDRAGATTLSAFGGYVTERLRLGIEGVWNRMDYRSEADRTILGGSVFGSIRVSEQWDVLARLDRAREERGPVSHSNHLAIAGVAYSPHPQIRVMPNVYITKREDASDVYAEARLTLEILY